MKRQRGDKVRIRQLRESKNIKQKEIAEKLGIDPSAYSNKEAGRRAFTVEELLKLELILETTISEMYKELKEKIQGGESNDKC